MKWIRSDWRNLVSNIVGLITSCTVLAFIVIAVIHQPVLDAAANEKAARLAEAKMKARLFTKFPDPAIAQMSEPVSTLEGKK